MIFFRMHEIRMKHLYRSKTKRMIAGVCGGVGEYISVDPTFVRLCVAFFTLVTGVAPGIILYILAAIIVPEEGEDIGSVLPKE